MKNKIIVWFLVVLMVCAVPNKMTMISASESKELSQPAGETGFTTEEKAGTEDASPDISEDASKDALPDVSEDGTGDAPEEVSPEEGTQGTVGSDSTEENGEEEPASEEEKAEEDTPLPKSRESARASISGWTIEGPSDMWRSDGRVLEIIKGGSLRIDGSGAQVSDKSIQIITAEPVSLTLHNVYMDSSAKEKSPIEVKNGANLNLILSGTNYLLAYAGTAIVVRPTASLIIDAVSDSAVLEVKASNNESLSGGPFYSAGIGSMAFEDSGAITINRGKITAEASGGGAGIGSGFFANAGKITINGGEIIAVSKGSGAGIGSGENPTISQPTTAEITINGGNIVGRSEASGAGIGGGYGSLVKSLNIHGGTVTGNSTSGYGIGPDKNVQGISKVSISGGTVNQIGNQYPYINNNEGEVVFLAEMSNKITGIVSVKVDGKEQNISGFHKGSGPGNRNFYFYMTGEDHIITLTDRANNSYVYLAAWTGGTAGNENFTISEYTSACDYIVKGDQDYRFIPNMNQLRIGKGKFDIYCIKGSTSQEIVFSGWGTANEGAGVNNHTSEITLHDINMQTKGIKLDHADVTINLAGKNSIDTSTTTNAPIEVHYSNLIIRGDGYLYCKGNETAGIGASKSSTFGYGSITIEGGNVTAESNAGAGIGGRSGGTIDQTPPITISGGTVTAMSNTGSGIGKGPEPGGSGITENIVYINGGSVKAVSQSARPIDGTPKNKDGEIVVPYELKNQKPTSKITVDNVPVKVQGLHAADDTSYYLYMSKKEHSVVSDNTAYNLVWDTGERRFKLKSPKPANVSAAAAVNRITVTAPADTSAYGAAKYSIDGTNWQTSNVFNNLKAGVNYTVYVKYSGLGEYAESDAAVRDVRTSNPSYRITVPAKMTAGDASANIAVNTAQAFELGYGGQVNVKVTGGINSAGLLTLTRTVGTDKPAISSQFKVKGSNFTNMNNNVAVFKAKTDAPVPISFAAPTHASGTIPAGSYSGTVVFNISYVQ